VTPAPIGAIPRRAGLRSTAAVLISKIDFSCILALHQLRYFCRLVIRLEENIFSSLHYAAGIIIFQVSMRLSFVFGPLPRTSSYTQHPPATSIGRRVFLSATWGRQKRRARAMIKSARHSRGMSVYEFNLAGEAGQPAQRVLGGIVL
jgi:hypothetical protein